MAGSGFAVGGPTAAASAGRERLERLLSRYQIELSPGRSRSTGQPVVRLVDASTGRQNGRLPRSFSEELAGLMAEMASRDQVK